MDTTTNEKVSILFICLGNICRSPAAHAVMQHLVEERGCADRYMIDSAGIGNWHEWQISLLNILLLLVFLTHIMVMLTILT